MKKLAKLLSVLLTVAMLFSLMACTVTPDAPNDGENNGEGELENKNETAYAQLSDKIVTSAITKLESAKSVKFSGVIKLEEKDGYAGSEEYENEVAVTVTVSEINGKLAVYAKTVGSQSFGEAELVMITETTYAGGYVYSRTYYYPVGSDEDEIAMAMENALWTRDYDNMGITGLSIEELSDIVKSLVTDEALSGLKAEIVKQLEASAGTNGKLELSYDLAPDIARILDYLKTVKGTDTLGKIINDALAAVAPELTVEKLIAAVLACESKTVSEALAELEAYTVSEGMGTLQEIWDGFVSSPSFDMLVSMMEMPEDVVAVMKAFKLADIINVYGEYTVADVLYTVMASQSEEPEDDYEYEGDGDDEFDGEFEEITPVPPTPSSPVMKAPEGFMMSLLGEVIPMLNVTFDQMGMDVYEFIYVTFGIDVYPETKANKLEFKVYADFDTESGELTAVGFGADIDVENKSYYYDYDEETRVEGIGTLKLKIEFAISEIPDSAAVIEIPADNMITDEAFED